MWGVSVTHPMLASFLIWGVSLTHPMLTLFICGQFLLHIPSWLLFLTWGVSFTHPVLTLFLCGEFLIHIPYWLIFLNVGSFSYTSHADFVFMWGVFLTHPVLASFLFGEFLLHIPCCLHFLLGSFSDTSYAYFFFYVVSFSYTSRAVLMSMQGVSLTHPVLKLSVRKRLCQFLRKEAVKTGRPKNKPELKKLISERIGAQQTAQKTTPQKKSWMEDGSGNQREKVTLRGEKGALHKRKQSY